MSYNPIIVWLLYSPLHAIMSGNTMVVNYTGRKSGKKYKLPVGYLRQDNVLLTVSYKHRKWWRNLRGGVPVTLRLQGNDVMGQSDVVEDEPGVMEGLRSFIAGNPLMSRMLHVNMGLNGQLDETSLRDAASIRVIVRTTLG